MKGNECRDDREGVSRQKIAAAFELYAVRLFLGDALSVVYTSKLAENEARLL